MSGRMKEIYNASTSISSETQCIVNVAATSPSTSTRFILCFCCSYYGRNSVIIRCRRPRILRRDVSDAMFRAVSGGVCLTIAHSLTFATSAAA